MPFRRKYLNSPVIIFMMLAMIHISAINWIIYRQQKYALKESFERQLKAGISEDKLTHFSFTKEQLNQLDWQDEKEFVVKGVFYDVISKHSNGDLIEIVCLQDKEEKALESLAEKMADRSDGDDEYSVLLLKFIDSPKLTLVQSKFIDGISKQFPGINLGIDRFNADACFRPPII